MRIKLTYLEIPKFEIAWFKTQHLAALREGPKPPVAIEVPGRRAEQVKEEGRPLPP